MLAFYSLLFSLPAGHVLFAFLFSFLPACCMHQSFALSFHCVIPLHSLSHSPLTAKFPYTPFHIIFFPLSCCSWSCLLLLSTCKLVYHCVLSFFSFHLLLLKLCYILRVYGLCTLCRSAPPHIPPCSLRTHAHTYQQKLGFVLLYMRLALCTDMHINTYRTYSISPPLIIVFWWGR